MSDRHLYKAKRTDNGEWVEGYYANCYFPTSDVRTGHFIIEYPGEYHEIYTETLCQCTGRKDKNGTLIWENDIAYMRCDGLSGYGAVVFERGCFWIDDKKRHRKYPLYNNAKYRVDGNVFDNPSLLKGGAE